MSPGEWHCNEQPGLVRGTEAYDICKQEHTQAKFIESIPIWLVDIWISWELYAW